MTISILLDENVSLDVYHRLRSLGYDVLAIAQLPPQQGGDEADLVEKFFDSHPIEAFAGRLVFLSPGSVRIR